jgi:hypothetical protein
LRPEDGVPKKEHGALATPVPSAEIPSGIVNGHSDTNTKQGLEF